MLKSFDPAAAARLTNPVPQVSFDVTDILNVGNDLRGCEIGGTFRASLEPVDSGQHISAQSIDRCKDAGDRIIAHAVCPRSFWPPPGLRHDARLSGTLNRADRQLAEQSTTAQVARLRLWLGGLRGVP